MNSKLVETSYYLHRVKSRCQSVVGGGEQPNKVQPILLGNEENQAEYFPALNCLACPVCYWY